MSLFFVKVILIFFLCPVSFLISPTLLPFPLLLVHSFSLLRHPTPLPPVLFHIRPVFASAQDFTLMFMGRSLQGVASAFIAVSGTSLSCHCLHMEVGKENSFPVVICYLLSQHL